MKPFERNFYLYSIMMCIILVVYAFYVFPIPGTDAIVFIPTAYLYSKGFGMTNPLYFVTQLTDLTGTNKFNYYVPFFPYLLGLLSKIRPGFTTIFLFCSLFSSISLLLYTKVVAKMLPQRPGMLLKAMALLSLSYIATYLLPTVGRPENITGLLVFLIYILYRKQHEISKPLYMTLLAVLFAMIFASQVICFFFCFLFYVLYDVVNSQNIYKTILRNVLLFVGTMVLFCIIVQVTPNGLANTIEGIRLHMKFVFSRTDRSMSLFLHYWVFANLNFGFLVIFLLATVFFIGEMYSKLKEAAKLKIIVSGAIILIIAAGVVKFILYASPTVYNATEFILPISAYIFCTLLFIGEGRLQKTLSTLVLVTFAAGSLVFVRNFILFVHTLNTGKDHLSAKVVVDKVTANNKHIYITGGLWSLFDDMNKISIFDEGTCKSGDTVLIQQAYRNFPPSLSGRYTVLYDWRTNVDTKFMGLKLSNRPHGYGFVMCRIN